MGGGGSGYVNHYIITFIRKRTNSREIDDISRVVVISVHLISNEGWNSVDSRVMNVFECRKTGWGGINKC